MKHFIVLLTLFSSKMINIGLFGLGCRGFCMAVGMLLISPANGANPVCTELKCEYIINPLGIDSRNPSLKWIINDSDRAEFQTAYQVLVASSKTEIDHLQGDLWNTGKVTSSRQNAVRYNGTNLVSGTRYWWKVRTWDKDGHVGIYSETASFETAMLNNSDWKAVWISGGRLRRVFSLPGRTIAHARAYLGSKGFCELVINGNRIGDHVLNPAPGSATKRARYSTYDVTASLKSGRANAVGILVAEGWGFLHPLWGANAVIFRLDVVYTDGTSTTITSDTTWKEDSDKSPVLDSNIYDGETYDARNEDGWTIASYDDSSWAKAGVHQGPPLLSAQLVHCKVMETITPISLVQPSPGTFVFDMGKNIAGWARLTVQGSAGTTITLRFAEVLQGNGMIDTRSLRKAKATDRYTLKGKNNEVWEPRFTYHGFRYVEITGFPGIPTLKNLQGRMVYSDVEDIGDFSCSNSLINNIHKMYVLSQKDNIQGYPSDCCQRNERLGWTGDAQVTSESACMNLDMAAFYDKWFYDLDDCQDSAGRMPDWVPGGVNYEVDFDVPWHSVRVTTPWDVFIATGDKCIVEKHYSRMADYLRFLQKSAEKDFIMTHNIYKDWASPVTGKPDAGGLMCSTAYYFRSAWLMSKFAEVLGKTEEAITYSKLAGKIRSAFNDRFLKGDYYDNNAQAANALALYFGIVPDDRKDDVLNTLVKDIRAQGNHLTTGVLGTKALMEALWMNGRSDVAYDLAAQNTFPSWGDMVSKGMATTTEWWDFVNSNGREEQGSFNHPMLGGGVGAWVYKGIAGISPTKAGYEEVTIKPEVVGDLTWARGSVRTVRGVVSDDWMKVNDNQLNINIQVPVNSQAEVYVPTLGMSNVIIGARNTVIWDSDKAMGIVAGVKYKTATRDFIVWTVGSGNYRFIMTGRGGTKSKSKK